MICAPACCVGSPLCPRSRSAGAADRNGSICAIDVPDPTAASCVRPRFLQRNSPRRAHSWRLIRVNATGVNVKLIWTVATAGNTWTAEFRLRWPPKRIRRPRHDSCSACAGQQRPGRTHSLRANAGNCMRRTRRGGRKASAAVSCSDRPARRGGIGLGGPSSENLATTDILCDSGLTVDWVITQVGPSPMSRAAEPKRRRRFPVEQRTARWRNKRRRSRLDPPVPRVQT